MNVSRLKTFTVGLHSLGEENVDGKVNSAQEWKENLLKKNRRTTSKDLNMSMEKYGV